jgi:hypothetical protein
VVRTTRSPSPLPSEKIQILATVGVRRAAGSLRRKRVVAQGPRHRHQTVSVGTAPRNSGMITSEDVMVDPHGVWADVFERLGLTAVGTVEDGLRYAADTTAARIEAEVRIFRDPVTVRIVVRATRHDGEFLLAPADRVRTPARWKTGDARFDERVAILAGGTHRAAPPGPPPSASGWWRWWGRSGRSWALQRPRWSQRWPRGSPTPRTRWPRCATSSASPPASPATRRSRRCWSAGSPTTAPRRSPPRSRAGCSRCSPGSRRSRRCWPARCCRSATSTARCRCSR